MGKELARDKYLKRKYNISLEEYNEMLKKCDGGCWVCGKKPKLGRSLHTDHDHRVARTKVLIKRWYDAAGRKFWAASAKITPNRTLITTHLNRKRAKQAIERELLRLSVRGLLCWIHNTAIQKFRDNQADLAAASLYLRNYQDRLKGTKDGAIGKTI